MPDAVEIQATEPAWVRRFLATPAAKARPVEAEAILARAGWTGGPGGSGGGSPAQEPEPDFIRRAIVEPGVRPARDRANPARDSGMPNAQTAQPGMGV